MLINIVGAAAVVLLVVYVYNQITLHFRRQRFAKEHGCEPLMHHYPLKDPIFGIDNIRASIKAAKEHRLLDRFLDNFNKYGNTFGNKVAGKSMVITRDPANVKAILSLKFKDFSLGNRITSLGPLLGKGIFTMDGEFWSHSRAMIRPNFTRDQVADLDAFERHFQLLLKLIPADGATVDLQELFFRLTIDSATEFLFGTSTHTLKEGANTSGVSGPEFAKAFNTAQDACAKRFRLGPFRHFFSDPEGDKATQICHSFVGQFVDEAVKYRQSAHDVEKKGDDKYVFLHQLATETSDKQRLQDELLNVLLAGRDTTASLLGNMWFMLAKHPEIFAKLRKEVLETYPNGEAPTYESLRNMKYLKYCMNESLRIHPVVPSNSRLCINDTVLPTGGGASGTSPLFIPRGTLVSYSTYGMHRRTDFFGADALAFRPERWESLRPGWEYLPFNGGPRICLGQQYALTEAGFVTVRLCQVFGRCESRDEGEWREGLTLTLCSGGGTRVGLVAA